MQDWNLTAQREAKSMDCTIIAISLLFVSSEKTSESLLS